MAYGLQRKRRGGSSERTRLSRRTTAAIWWREKQAIRKKDGRRVYEQQLGGGRCEQDSSGQLELHHGDSGSSLSLSKLSISTSTVVLNADMQRVGGVDGNRADGII